MIRCYLPPHLWEKAPVRLAGGEAHHLARVLRVRPGERLLCFDGQGRECEAVVLGVSGGRLLLRLGPERKRPRSAGSLTLAVAIPGQGMLDRIVHEATQFGVERIFPIQTERSVVRLPPERFERKCAHLRRIALEAAKQSGVNFLPALDSPLPFSRLVKLLPEYDLALLASVESPHEPLRPLLRAGPGGSRLILLVGPEGDFTPEEIARAEGAGAHRISLGSSVLRCETACVALLSVVSFLLREG